VLEGTMLHQTQEPPRRSINNYQSR